MNINLESYTYSLPDERIAQHPLSPRDSSNLLHYNKGQISHKTFNKLPGLLPDGSLLVFNNTRVIPARLFFEKSTGAIIEIFLLEPVSPSQNREIAMTEKGPVTWKCMIRNLKKWKNETLSLEHEGLIITANLEDRESQHVTLSWSTERTFSEILEEAGRIPLPPYMKREVEDKDREAYQTIYAQYNGAVAAPTAGLHFTDTTFSDLESESTKIEELTLHVSAGTFQPIKATNIEDHKMHEEEVLVTRNNLLSFLSHKGHIIPVGTTSMRTLESIYWYGVRLIRKETDEFFIPQMYPYEHDMPLPSRQEALEAVIQLMDKIKVEKISGRTEIFIFPGYEFKMCNGLVTNFHLPGSTLILLVAALIGDDWKKVYSEALNRDYRFLSYGDSSLLIP